MSNVIEMPSSPERREKLADLERQRLERESLEWARRAVDIRRRIDARSRPSGPGAKAERIRVAEALFQLSERVKRAGRGGLRRVIDRYNPQAANGYLYDFTLDPALPRDRRSERIARLRKDMRIYRQLAEAMANELGVDSDREIAALFEATSYAGADQGISAGLDDATVRIVRALRLIGGRVAQRHDLPGYFADLTRCNVVAINRHAAEFTDSDRPGYGGGCRPHHAWPRVDLFHDVVLESPVEIEEYGDCPRPSDEELALSPLRPVLRFFRRLSFVVAPGSATGIAEPMILLQPTTAVFRDGAAWQQDPFWMEGWEPDNDSGQLAVNANGHEISYSLPPDFNVRKLPKREHPSEDLAQLLPVTPQNIDCLFQANMRPVNRMLDDYLASWQDGPTLAPKETALARLESKILYADLRKDCVCEIEGALDRDAIRRIEVFRQWRDKAQERAQAAWDMRFAQLARRDGN